MIGANIRSPGCIGVKPVSAESSCTFMRDSSWLMDAHAVSILIVSRSATSRYILRLRMRRGHIECQRRGKKHTANADSHFQNPFLTLIVPIKARFATVLSRLLLEMPRPLARIPMNHSLRRTG